MTDTAPQLHDIAHDAFTTSVATLARSVEASGWAPDYVVGVGRGGLVPAVYLAHRLGRPMLSVDLSAGVAAFAADRIGPLAAMSREGTRLLIVDDINDSGRTIAGLRTALSAEGADAAAIRFAVLIDNARSAATVDYRAETIDRHADKRWFVFPWEAMEDRAAIVAEALSVPERLG
ncbi:phosphoribosyltransferase [Sphingomonas jatrophae]|uniref:Phosphoribosyltransferase domain-containing protein n=1 Tax=Sphingomonas jatrophae TaxID=1166337 RepID=A0A1I6JB45_9SPHN|nr:phosphoribosyltransferase family protein [Sphingomonas jatrophae]SFR76243.1 hypothetical protein SAMN05192580_0057 [Sphingomonas jatrophae]